MCFTVATKDGEKQMIVQARRTMLRNHRGRMSNLPVGGNLKSHHALEGPAVGQSIPQITGWGPCFLLHFACWFCMFE